VLHNPFEIEAAWQEGTITSPKGDKAHVRINSITKEVFIKTRIGDGNHQEWRKTNSTYEAILSQGFQSAKPADILNAENAPTQAPVTDTAGQTNGHSSGIDYESVAPFGKRGRKHDG